MSYWSNVGKFWRGVRWLWTRAAGAGIKDLDVLKRYTSSQLIFYRKGWGPKRFLLVYLFDYGTRVHSGGAVVSWSRWWYDRRKRLGHAGFMTRLLNHIQENHGARSGGPLWGTQDTAWAVAGGLVFWLLGVPAIVWGAVRLVRWVL